MRMSVSLLLALGACSADPGEPGRSGPDSTDPVDTAGDDTVQDDAPVPGGLAAAFVPYTVRPGEASLEVDILELGEGFLLDDTQQDLPIAENLTITASLADLTPPRIGDPPFWIDGVQVPEDRRLPVELHGTVLDLWYMGPFDIESPTGLPVRIANTYGADPDGGTVELWVGSYGHSAWLKVGTASADGDDLVFDGDLMLISTLVLIDSEGQNNPPEAEPSDSIASFEGIVYGPDGEVAEEAHIRYCRGEKCLTTQSDAAGSFGLEDVVTGPGSFEVNGRPSGG